MNSHRYSYRIPDGKMVRVITSTDAKNEADDQFAIVHTLLTSKFNNRGIIAAHFGDDKSKTSMEDSYDEVNKLLNLMHIEPSSLSVKGASHPLSNETTPVLSAGADLIIKEAMSDDTRPLFVNCLGPLTDMASALLLEPRIAQRLTVIWIGGGAYPAGGFEYNLKNDIHAANVVFKSQVPVWQVPRDLYMRVIASMAELEHRVMPCGELGKYLFDQVVETAHTVHERNNPNRTGEYWCLADSAAVGLIMFDQALAYDWISAPEITSDMLYVHHRNHRPIRVYKYVDNRFIMEDFYAKLAMFTRKGD